MTWQEIDDGTWDKDEGYLSKQKNEKSRMLGIKECEYFSKLIFEILFSIHDKFFCLWRNSHKNALQKQLLEYSASTNKQDKLQCQGNRRNKQSPKIMFFHDGFNHKV